MKLNYLILGLIVLVGFSSCNNDDDNETPQPITKANIIGSVNLYDEGVTQIDGSGMTLTVEGTSPLITATTDENGEFTLSDVPFGTYTVSYTKVFFGPFRKFSIEHNNSTGSPTIITETPSLGQSSTTQITALSAMVIGTDVEISVTTDPAGNNSNTRYFRYFLSDNSDVSNENYTFYSEGIVSQINPRVVTLSQNDLTDAGFSSGSTVHLKAYGDSFWSNAYDDPELERMVFPNLNENSANSVSFVVP